MKLIDPTTISEWLPPHSLKWYKQLSALTNEYKYSWNSTHTEPNGESIFDQEVLQKFKNKKVLDVGCGHGEFTIQCSSVAKKIVGFDVTENFIQIGDKPKHSNVSFVKGNSKEGLPFANNEFDCAYNRKGPTSAYPSLKRVVKEGGEIFGLHPGDELGKELPDLFPNLFKSSKGTPILDTLEKRMEESNFKHFQIEVVNSIEFLRTPMDIIAMRCFGQKPKIQEILIEENLLQISNIFKRHATNNGLPITLSRYLVHAVV